MEAGGEAPASEPLVAADGGAPVGADDDLANLLPAERDLPGAVTPGAQG